MGAAAVQYTTFSVSTILFVVPCQLSDVPCQFLDSLVVRISACHVEGPGSIPGRGELFLLGSVLSVLTDRFKLPG